MNIKSKLKVFFTEFVTESKDFLIYLILTAALTTIFFKILFMMAFVPSGSMETTIPTGSIMLCSRMAYWNDNSPQRGDVIVFKRSVEEDKTIYTKRIVGIPNDVVEIIDGQTYINNELYEEQWLAEKPDDLDFGPYTLKSDEYFCMGDNRNYSHDCRYWEEHFVKEKDILAKGYYVISPKLNKYIEKIDYDFWEK